MNYHNRNRRRMGAFLLSALSCLYPSAGTAACEPYSFAVIPMGPTQESQYPGTSVNWAVVRLGDPTKQVSVQYATANITATAGQDYVAKSGTLVFQPNEVQKTVQASVYYDTVIEGAETVQLILSGTGTQPPATNGIGVIYDAVPPITTLPVPTTNSPVIVIEKIPSEIRDSTSTNLYATFHVWLFNSSATPSNPLRVSFHTEDITARANSDYFPTSGTLNLSNNAQVAAQVRVIQDSNVEGAETFKLKVQPPSGATGASEAIAVIID